MNQIKTYDGTEIELNDEQTWALREAMNESGKSGAWFGEKYISFATIKEINPIKNHKENYPQLPALGYEGIVKSAKKNGHIEALARGLKKAKAKLEKEGLSTKNIDSLLQLARNSYAGKKINFNGMTEYNPKYKTWEEAKAAGVF